MTAWNMTGSVVLATGLSLASAPAAAQDGSGDWEVRRAQAVRVKGDGTVEIQGWGDAALSLREDGGQVTGTWTTNVLEEVHWNVNGTLDGDQLTLRATENDSTDPEHNLVEQLVWNGTFSSDRIEGTVATWFRSMNRVAGQRPFTAIRTP